MQNGKSKHLQKMRRLTILGVYIKTDAYPNVKYKVEGLLEAKALSVEEINFQPHSVKTFSHRRSGLSGVIHAIGSALRFGYAHLKALRQVIRQDPPQRVYLPYPAVFVLFLLTLLPRRWRPEKIYADAFISLYDTIIEDRKIVSPNHILARWLYAVERRGYLAASSVFVDTTLNARYFASKFNLPPNKCISIPLSTNEEAYVYRPYVPHALECNVLFIGTFVPLQGVDVIAEAIALLKPHSNVRFRLIGDGQTANDVATILKDKQCTNVTWERNWQSASVLAKEIESSDICLGIFGTSDKCQRVWPLKNYAYMAVGRPIVTGATATAKEIQGEGNEDKFRCVPVGDPNKLANAIIELARDPARRVQYAKNSRQYYENHLSNEASLAKLLESMSLQDN